MPSGATIAVHAICAPLLTTRSTQIGVAMPTAARRHPRVSRQLSGSSPRGSSPSAAPPACAATRAPAPAAAVADRVSARTGDHAHVAVMRSTVTIANASTVPSAAPATPMPAPGIVKVTPRSVTARVGKISRKLNATSSTQLATARTLGTRMSPLACKAPTHRRSIAKMGTQNAKMRR